MINPFPYYSQSLDTDCGPTCLKMIAHFHGKGFDPKLMLRNPRIRIEGASMFDIWQAAKRIGLIPMAFQTKVRYLKHIELPAILYWNKSHFVVLYQIKKNSYHIADPQKGINTLSRTELQSNWECVSNGKNLEGIVLTFSTVVSPKDNT